MKTREMENEIFDILPGQQEFVWLPVCVCLVCVGWCVAALVLA